MIGLDTNILVRYIVEDDPKQTRLSRHVIEKQLSAQKPGFINQIVLCELVWVFESIYKIPRHDVAATLQRVLETNVFVVERADLAWRALENYRANLDFSDALIALTNAAYECDHTITFDRGAARRKAMRLLG